LEEFLQSLYVQTLRKKMEVCRATAATLMKSLQSSNLTVYEQRAGYKRWEAVTREGDVLEFMLELIRRHEREERAAAIQIGN